MFRAQSGGLSVVFKTQIPEPSANESTFKPLSSCQIQLPYKISCTQLRKTVRVNLEALPQIPAVLYMSDGRLIEGFLVDISASGAKIRVNQDLGSEVRNLQLIDACKINLTGALVLQTGIQLIGMTNDKESKTSFLRCQFARMKSSDEEMLESFIETNREIAPTPT